MPDLRSAGLRAVRTPARHVLCSVKKLLVLTAISAISIAAVAGNNVEVRKVTVIPLRRVPVSIEKNPDYGCCGIASVGVVPYTALFLLDVTVSDDVGKIYSLSCFEYHSWNNCRLPDTDSFAAEIKGNIIRITAEENNKKHRTYKVKYRIDRVSTSAPE